MLEKNIKLIPIKFLEEFNIQNCLKANKSESKVSGPFYQIIDEMCKIKF